MKRFAIVIIVTVCALAMMAWPQTPASKPGPELKKLQKWLGDWTYVQETKATSLEPAGKFTGKYKG